MINIIYHKCHTNLLNILIEGPCCDSRPTLLTVLLHYWPTLSRLDAVHVNYTFYNSSEVMASLYMSAFASFL